MCLNSMSVGVYGDGYLLSKEIKCNYMCKCFAAENYRDKIGLGHYTKCIPKLTNNV